MRNLESANHHFTTAPGGGRIELPAAARPDKEWMFIPALALLALVWFAQRARARRNPRTMPSSPAERFALTIMPGAGSSA